MNGQWMEERNSWDETVRIAPYHTDWTGKLPGPGFRVGHGLGLGGRDVANLGAGICHGEVVVSLKSGGDVAFLFLVLGVCFG
jgi:hypothetical protein